MDGKNIKLNESSAAAVGTAESELPKPGEFVYGDQQTYEVSKLLGKGTFGAVYMVSRMKDGKKFAMKCEHVHVKKQVLVMEYKVLLGANENKSPHFCGIEHKGKVKSRFLFVVMTLLGKNLWDLRKERAPLTKFSVNTALKVAEQCLHAVKDLHKVGYLHRDLKPPNFAIGTAVDNHTIYIIDFGLCRKFNSEQKDLRLPRLQAPFRGTVRYASRSAHLNQEQARKDDLEGWFYMIIEFTSGKLPWRHCKSCERDKMLKMKEEARTPEGMKLMLFDCPFEAYSKIFKYIDALAYPSVPDYDYIYHLLVTAAEENGCLPDDPIDWDPTKPYKGPRFLPERDFTKKNATSVIVPPSQLNAPESSRPVDNNNNNNNNNNKEKEKEKDSSARPTPPK